MGHLFRQVFKISQGSYPAKMTMTFLRLSSISLIKVSTASWPKLSCRKLQDTFAMCMSNWHMCKFHEIGKIQNLQWQRIQKVAKPTRISVYRLCFLTSCFTCALLFIPMDSMVSKLSDHVRSHDIRVSVDLRFVHLNWKFDSLIVCPTSCQHVVFWLIFNSPHPCCIILCFQPQVSKENV